MQEKLQGTENTFAVTGRRACPRFRATSLVYIDIGNVNGAIVTSLSENGLSLTAAATLGNGDLRAGPLRMRIQFPGIPEAIEASGEVVWTGPSGKEAGVRFVEIEEAAREQIRGWLSDQTSLNELRPEPPQLPKMQLPTSRRAKPRRPRLSFADVASSRVDVESETEVEDSLESIPQPRDLPPLQAGSNVFRDGPEVVASAFESPALTEDPTRNIGSQNGQTTPPTTHEQQRQEATPAIPERRQHSRRQILLFTYAVLGEDNGGLVFNLGEGGLAVTAAAPLQGHHFSKMRVRFPDSEDWIETSGRLAWKSDSGKEVGIEFVDLPNDARLRIREWASQEEPAISLPSEESEARTSQSPVHRLPSFMESDESSAEPIETPASFEEQPFENRAFEEQRFDSAAGTPPAYSSALFETGSKGIFERASVRRRVAKIKPPRIGDRAAGPRALARKALGMAAGVALAAGGWMFFQRTSSNGASGIVTQNLPSIQSSREAGPPQPATDSPVYSNRHSAIQTDTKSSLQQIDSGSPLPSKTIVSPSNNPDLAFKVKVRSERAVSNAPQANLPHRSEQSQLVLPARREQETKAPQMTAPVPSPTPENKLAESKPVEMKPVETKPTESRPIEVAQAVPTPNPRKDANAPPPNLNSNLPLPTAAPPVDIEKEKLAVTPRQPEARVTRTPTVTVSFDPYPSIRMPKAEKSKKSHQGKSLQMGRLLARVDPTYPEEAKQQGLEGTVKVHAIFSREGTVQNLTSVSGPPVLVTAAMNAVRQWRYSHTILGGQTMETEEDVTVLFRLANSDSQN